jgi:hypothetical protein
VEFFFSILACFLNLRLNSSSGGGTVKYINMKIYKSIKRAPVFLNSRYFLAMARIAKVVVPNIPHHITQRGNRRMDTFFSEADYREYETLRRHERTGRPLGNADFVEKVKKLTARVFRRQKSGPKKQ